MPNPTNGELSIMIKNLSDSFELFKTDTFAVFKKNNSEQHSNIESHVKETNGRVTTLEKTKYMALGALAFTNVIAVPIILKYIMNYLGI